jgi:hypothetical protein
MLGTCGEYIVDSTNITDDIINNIKEYELGLGSNIALPSPFIIKKIGIKADSECSIKLNGRNFTIEPNGTLEFGYNVFDIKSIVAQTEGVKLTIRYLY